MHACACACVCVYVCMHACKSYEDFHTTKFRTYECAPLIISVAAIGNIRVCMCVCVVRQYCTVLQCDQTDASRETGREFSSTATPILMGLGKAKLCSNEIWSFHIT